MKNPDNNKPKILLHCLPPAQTLMPSITLNVLKSTLKQNRINSEILYWNIKLEPFYKPLSSIFGEADYEFSRLLPFIYRQSIQYEDSPANENIQRIIYQQAEVALRKKEKKFSSAGLSDMLHNTSSRITTFIKDTLRDTDMKGVMLCGFTAKFYQWLPGLLVAEEIKKNYPGIKTIIGGFDSQSAAHEMLRNFSCFDIAVWGEGEYPLLHICREFEAGSDNFSEIAGILYRKKDEIIVSPQKNRQYLDLNHFPEPDYDDFFSIAKEDKKNRLFFCYPIESIRGCPWNRCNFCVLNKGYRYRERSANSVSKEVSFAIKKYRTAFFQFMDNSLIGKDKNRLNTMLEQLTSLSLTCRHDFSLSAEIIPHELDAAYYKKLALAGFRMMQVGGEAFADSLLRKMNKKNSFSDNLLAYKFCLKYGITPIGANIITGIPDETARDIKTSIDNIPFLRFFVGPQAIKFTESKFALDKQSHYYKKLDKKNITNYTEHFLFNYLPQQMTCGMNRFELFHFCKNKSATQKKLWGIFFNTLSQYYKARFTYRIYNHQGVILYEEYYQGVKNDSIVFDQPAEWQVLVNSNTQLCSFESMLQSLKDKYQGITAAKLKTVMQQLKSKHLIYFDDTFNKIISIIDTDCLL